MATHGLARQFNLLRSPSDRENLHLPTNFFPIHVFKHEMKNKKETQWTWQKQIILTEMNESSDDTKTDHTEQKREIN